MKKKISIATLLLSSLLLCGCNQEIGMVEEPKIEKNLEIDQYVMNGWYNPSTKILITEDYNGRLDEWENPEFLLGLSDGLDGNENEQILVHAYINTNNTKSIDDDTVEIVKDYAPILYKNAKDNFVVRHYKQAVTIGNDGVMIKDLDI